MDISFHLTDGRFAMYLEFHSIHQNSIYFMAYSKIFIKYTKKVFCKSKFNYKPQSTYTYKHTAAINQIRSLLYWMRFKQVHVTCFGLHCLHLPIRLMVRPRMNTELVCERVLWKLIPTVFCLF